MAKKNEFESIKVKTETVDKVRKSKAVTGVPIGTFFDQAANEKLVNLKKKKQ